jgi:hypothetical protein
MWGSGSAVGGPYTRGARIQTEVRREGLRAACLSIFVTVLAPTVGYGNAMVGIMTTTVDELTEVPACVAPTVTLDSAQKASATSGEPLAILLRIRDTAHVPHDVLTTAKADVTRVYREAGIEALWPTAESLFTESNAIRQAALTIAIVSMEQAERMNSEIADGRVGFAARTADGDGQLAYVIYDRVERLTGGNGVRRASMLAIAMAHEIGHLLLPPKGHSLRGVMRAEWTRADLQLAQRQLASFTPREGELLRKRISVSRYRLTGKGIQKYICDARVR